MRHRIYGKHLGRNKNERQRLFTGLLRELQTHGSIKTTLTKARAVSSLISESFSIVKLGPRLGDQAMMVQVSLIKEKVEKKKSK